MGEGVKVRVLPVAEAGGEEEVLVNSLWLRTRGVWKERKGRKGKGNGRMRKRGWWEYWSGFRLL